MHWRQGNDVLVSALIGGVLMAGGCIAKQDGGQAPLTIQEQMTVKIDYTLTVDGAVVDTSEGRGPLSYVHGQGQIIPGLERELIGLQVGDVKDVTVAPADGYGEVNPQAVIEVSREQLPKGSVPEVGQLLRGQDQQGRPFQSRIVGVADDVVTLDLNHPLAGKTLSFHVTVVDISPQS